MAAALGGITALFFLLSAARAESAATSDEKSLQPWMKSLATSPNRARRVRAGRLSRWQDNLREGLRMANVEGNVAITPQSVFDIGSTSKQFTAASVLLLKRRQTFR